MFDKAFCTIVTSSHLPYALTLFDSIRRYDQEVGLHVLVVDIEVEVQMNIPEGVIIYKNSDLSQMPYAQEIYNKYFKKRNNDRYRWSMKPVFLNYLLSQGFTKVTFLDCDIYFFGGYQFLFDLLDENNVLLTPHWRSLDPSVDSRDFSNNYTNGFYNAGFVAVNKRAANVLLWWANMCHFKCEIKLSKGFYVDQGYLSLFPMVEEKVKVIHHRGCNVASWNDIENERQVVNGELLINGKYPVVFIHFSTQLFDRAISGVNTSLNGHLIVYMKHLIDNGLKPPKKWVKWLENQKKHKPSYEI